MSEKQLTKRNRDRAILRALFARPMTILEIENTLRAGDEMPPEWTAADLRRWVRKLHDAGTVCRLSVGSAKDVLWWVG